MEIRRVCCGGGGEAKVFGKDGVGAAAGAVGAVAVVAVAVIGASRSGSVIVVSWDVFMPETSKSELASGEMDLRSPVVSCDWDGPFCTVGQHRFRRVLPGSRFTLHEGIMPEWTRELHTSSLFCTVCCLTGAAAVAVVSPASRAGAVPAASSEHSFLKAGCCNGAASSSGLFLGVPSLEACLRGEGLARRERLRLASRPAFFSGLAPSAGDLGDIWTLASSEPRTRRLVGVAVALILGGGR